MWPELTKGSDKVLDQFQRWKGQHAQVLSYSISHSQLLLRVHRVSELGNFYLYLKDCYRVEFDDHWYEANLEIEEKEGKHGTEYLITDGNRFYAHCGVAPFSCESDETLRLDTQTDQNENGFQHGVPGNVDFAPLHRHRLHLAFDEK